MRVAVAGLMNAKTGLVENAFGQTLTGHFIQFGLGVEEIDLGRAPAMKMKMQALALASKCGWRGSIGFWKPVVDGVANKPSSARRKRGRLLRVRRRTWRGSLYACGTGGSRSVHGNKGYSLVMNSSMLSMMRTVAVQAAVSLSPPKALASSEFFHTICGTLPGDREGFRFLGLGGTRHRGESHGRCALGLWAELFQYALGEALAASTKVTLLRVTRAASGVLDRCALRMRR